MDTNKIKETDDLFFPEFDDIKVSTKTFIIMTNIVLNLDKLHTFLPITDYVVVPKKRGRKKKIEVIDPNKDIKTGSIITAEYKGVIRGVDLKKKKKKDKKEKNRGKYFRNSVTIIMIINGKKINYKVSRNGKIQMTGCKLDEQAESCVEWFWDYIKDRNDIYDIVKFEGASSKDEMSFFKTMYIPAMRNIDFGVNFCIDRERLDEYVNTSTPYHSLLETSFGYTGVSIKVPLKKSIVELDIKQFRYSLEDKEWLPTEMVKYSDYLKLLPPKDVAKKLKKDRYTTFLVFHSGRIIVSSLEAEYTRATYYEFLDIIRACYHLIKENLLKW